MVCESDWWKLLHNFSLWIVRGCSWIFCSLLWRQFVLWQCWYETQLLSIVTLDTIKGPGFDRVSAFQAEDRVYLLLVSSSNSIYCIRRMESSGYSVLLNCSSYRPGSMLTVVTPTTSGLPLLFQYLASNGSVTVSSISPQGQVVPIAR